MTKPVIPSSGGGREKLPPRPFNPAPVWLSLWAALLWLIVRDLELDFQTVLYGWEDMLEYFSRYGRPDFSELPHFLALMGETLATALWGTAISLVGAAILAPLAARNMSPGALAYRLTREALNFMRAMPDLLLALIFVAALGLGPLPGALALGVHMTGFLGKFFAEQMERIDPGVVEAAAAVGATRLQTVAFVGWPSILREMLGYALYTLDRNVRMASVLGLVGAGGIGLALHDTLRLFEYGQAAALILLILAVLLAFDYASAWLRGRLC